MAHSALKDETRGRTVGEQASLAVCDPSFCSTDTAAAVQDHTLSLDRTRFRCDGPHQRNLELERQRQCELHAETRSENDRLGRRLVSVP